MSRDHEEHEWLSIAKHYYYCDDHYEEERCEIIHLQLIPFSMAASERYRVRDQALTNIEKTIKLQPNEWFGVPRWTDQPPWNTGFHAKHPNVA